MRVYNKREKSKGEKVMDRIVTGILAIIIGVTALTLGIGLLLVWEITLVLVLLVMIAYVVGYAIDEPEEFQRKLDEVFPDD